MSLIKWNRRSPMPAFSSLIEDFFNDSNDFFKPWSEGPTLPAVNVTELDGVWKIELAAPGLEKEDFDVKIKNGILTVNAEKESTEEVKEENVARKEFNYTKFSRSFWLPENIREEGLEAKYDNGILTLMLPQKEPTEMSEVKRINVN